MSKKLSLGIDVGTTYNAMSLYANGRLTELTFPGVGPQLPSAVYWVDGENPIVGKKGINAAYKHPECLYTHFKRRMADAGTEPAYGGHTAIELTAETLKECIHVACKSEPEIKQYLDGAKPRDELSITVTHPANWGVQQQDWLRESARLAGFEIDAFIQEPNAAVFRLLEEKQHLVKQSDKLATIDFGGGTLDNIVQKWNQGRLDTVVGATGDPLLGGETITGVIFQHFSNDLRLNLADAFDPERGLSLAHKSLSNQKKRRQAWELWKVANEAKELLSTADEATVFFNGRSGPEELTLTAVEYDAITKDIWERVEIAVAGMLADSGLDCDQIQKVGVVGGSAMARGMVPHVANVTGKPECDILVSSSSAHVVASGAAIQGCTEQQADSHFGRGIGIQVLEAVNGSKAYTYKMLAPTNAIIKAAGETFQDTGQRIGSRGGRARLKLQFVEAKPAVVVPRPTNGVPSLLDDSEVVLLQKVTRGLVVPEGEHEVLLAFSVANGSIHYHLSFPSLPDVDGISGRLSTTAEEPEEDADRPPIDAVIMLDTSSSMTPNAKFDNAVVALDNVVTQSANANVRLCIVRFGTVAEVLCPFETDPLQVMNSVRKLKPAGGTPLEGAIQKTATVLRTQPNMAHRMAVIVTDGHPNDPQLAELAASDLKQDTELVCFGVGPDVDQDYLLRMATSPEHFFFADDPSQIPTLFDDILELILSSGTALTTTKELQHA